MQMRMRIVATEVEVDVGIAWFGIDGGYGLLLYGWMMRLFCKVVVGVVASMVWVWGWR